MLVITSLSGRSGYYCRRAARWYLSAAAACAKINWPPLSASIKANEKESQSLLWERAFCQLTAGNNYCLCVCVIIAQRWMRIGSERDEEIGSQSHSAIFLDKSSKFGIFTSAKWCEMCPKNSVVL
jgi:hypothetical protein